MQKRFQGISKNDLVTVIPMGLSAFFLLGGYAFFRPSINSLYKEVYGAENLPLAMGFGVLGVLATVWIYARILSWGGPRKTMGLTCVGSAFLILLHYVGLQSELKWLVFTGYLLKEAYIVLIIEQYWSFLNSKISASSGKKLFGFILGFSSIGGILGSRVSAEIVVDLGSEMMIAIAGGITLVAAIFSEIGFRISGEPSYDVHKQRTLKDKLALSLFGTKPALKYIFFVILLSQVFSAVTELRFHSILESTYGDTELQNQFENRFWSWVETAGIVLNFIISPVLLSFVSIRVIHFIFPALHVCTVLALIFFPSMGTASASFLVFKCTDYSLFRAAKEILYIPFSFSVRYRVKEVIDVFGYRAGKGGVSFAISGVQALFGSGFAFAYSWIALAAAGLWFAAVPKLTQKVDNDEADESE